MQGAASPLTRRGPDLFPCTPWPRCTIVWGAQRGAQPTCNANTQRSSKLSLFGISPLQEYDEEVKSLVRTRTSSLARRITGLNENQGNRGLAGIQFSIDVTRDRQRSRVGTVFRTHGFSLLRPLFNFPLVPASVPSHLYVPWTRGPRVKSFGSSFDFLVTL